MKTLTKVLSNRFKKQPQFLGLYVVTVQKTLSPSFMSAMKIKTHTYLHSYCFLI